MLGKFKFKRSMTDSGHVSIPSVFRTALELEGKDKLDCSFDEENKAVVFKKQEDN